MQTPAYAVRYLSYELVQALEKLSEQQQALVYRVVFKDKYTGGRSLIPWRYIGPGKLVSAESYSGRGWQDEEGRWHDVGWHHQLDFVAAVKLAKRAVLEVGTEEGLAHVAKAKDSARAKLNTLTRTRIAIAQDETVDANARLKAIKDNEALALLGVDEGRGARGEEDAGEGTLEADWWKAAAE